MTTRTLLSILALAATVLMLGRQVERLLADLTVWPPDDFVEYWAAGRLCLNGENPYSPELLLPLERSAGRDTDEAVMMWNPPWTLGVVMPLGALPARPAQLAWLAVGLISFGVSALLLARAYAVPGWLAGTILFTFAPTYLVLHAGQIGPLLVLGAAGFAFATRTNRPALAGAATVLLAIKPHLVYLLWLAILVEAVTHRRWRILAGGIGLGAVAALLPLAFDPDVYSEYQGALRDHPPAQWVSLTVGTLLRLAFGESRFWLQFIPVLAGLAWFVGHWRRHGRQWDWADQLSGLLLVSFVTSPYGAWHFDLVLLAIPLVVRAGGLAASGWTPRTKVILGGYFAANGVMIGLNLSSAYSYWFAWVAPLILAAYFMIRSSPAVQPFPESRAA
jgi:hypothetical protein